MITQEELRELLREQVAETGASRFARQHGISETLVSLVTHGHQKPGPRIAEALGYRKIIRFEALQTPNEAA